MYLVRRNSDIADVSPISPVFIKWRNRRSVAALVIGRFENDVFPNS